MALSSGNPLLWKLMRQSTIGHSSTASWNNQCQVNDIITIAIHSSLKLLLFFVFLLSESLLQGKQRLLCTQIPRVSWGFPSWVYFETFLPLHRRPPGPASLRLPSHCPCTHPHCCTCPTGRPTKLTFTNQLICPSLIYN